MMNNKDTHKALLQLQEIKKKIEESIMSLKSSLNEQEEMLAQETGEKTEPKRLDEDAILQYANEKFAFSEREIATDLKAPLPVVRYFLKRAIAEGHIQEKVSPRGTKYERTIHH